MDSHQKELVVVTGFGPFRQYLVNASWEAAKGLQRAGLGEGIETHIVEIPVSYSKAQQAIAEIWQSMKPKVVVHLGIAPGAKCIILEQTAKNHGYKDRDVCGFCPANNCCIEEGLERLDSIICMKSLAKHFKGLGLDVIYSRDAGRRIVQWLQYQDNMVSWALYCFPLPAPITICDFSEKYGQDMLHVLPCRYLCDFVYYCSLQYGQRRAALFHVPASGSLANPETLVPQLQAIIQALLCQLDAYSISMQNKTGPKEEECTRRQNTTNIMTCSGRLQRQWGPEC